MRRFFWVLCLCFVFFGTSVFAAVFNAPNQLINIPIYESFKRGDLEYGASVATYGDSETEFDFMLNYAVTDYLKTGVTLVDPTHLVGHVHSNFFEIKEGPFRFAMAGGVQNLFGNKEVNTWDNQYPTTENITFSQYLTATFALGPVELYQGVGTRRFHAPRPKKHHVQGYFGGISVPLFAKSRLAFEFDGKDWNLGLSVPLKPYARLEMALTELFLEEDTNPNYADAPQRHFTIGVTFTDNILFFKERERKEEEERLARLNKMKSDLEGFSSELKTQILSYELRQKELDEYVSRLKSAMHEDAQYIYDSDLSKKSQKRQHYLSLERESAEKVMKYYYDSLELYARKDFMGAIEKLKAATLLDPSMPQLYVRLGTIYYELGMKEEALLNWKKAAVLDPENPVLKKLLK